MEFLKNEEWKSLVKLMKKRVKNSEDKPILWVGAGTFVHAGYPGTPALIEKIREFSLKSSLPDYNPFRRFSVCLSSSTYQSGRGVSSIFRL